MQIYITGKCRVIQKETKMNDFIKDVIKYPNNFNIIIRGVASENGYGIVSESEVSVKQLADIFDALDKKEEERHA